MRTMFLSVLALIGLVGPVAQGLAQEGTQPVAVVSFCGYERFFKSIDVLGKLAGNDNLGAGAEATVKMMTGGQGLAGLDTKRPWGAVAELKGGVPSVYGVLPVTDLKALVQVLQQMQVAIRDAGDGIYNLQIQSTSLFVKQQGDWAYIAADAEQLKSPLPNPAKGFGDLPEKYLVAVRLNAANVPPEMLAPYLQMLEMTFQANLQQADGETAADFEARKAIAEKSLAEARRALNDLDQLTLGFAVDDQTHSAYLDLLATAKPGTAMAQRFAKSKSMRTHFAGFADPTALFSGMWAALIEENGQAQALAALDAAEAKWLRSLETKSLSADVSKKLSQSIRDVMDVAKATVKSGKAEGGAAAYYQPSSLTVVLGGAISDGAKLEKVLGDVLELARKEDPAFAKVVKLDVEEFQGLKLHRAKGPLPDSADPNMIKVFGRELELVVALGAQSGYLAVGPDSLKILKQVIAKSQSEGEREVPPLRLSLALGAAATLAADVGEEAQRPQAQVVAALLSQSRGLDHLSLIATPVDNGTRVRLEVEEGILKILGTLVQAAAPGVGAPPPQGGAKPF